MPADVHFGREPQSASAVLMVRPACFGHNPQTAASNLFQHAGDAPSNAYAAAALREFDAAAAVIAAAGVAVISVADTPVPPKPDALFPNNWVSFHEDGTLVLYPMLAPNRRWERRAAILDQVFVESGFRAARTVDLSRHELQGRYLEGTGSLVLDRSNKIAYACTSARTDPQVLAEFADALGYDVLRFTALDRGEPIYHTNVLMAIGARFAILCSEALPLPAERAAVAGRLRSMGHDLIEISAAQMRVFAGNILELTSPQGALIALSSTALESLENAQRRTLEAHARLLPLSIPTIERFGGGGIRCMLAEIHVPRRADGVRI